MSKRLLKEEEKAIIQVESGKTPKMSKNESEVEILETPIKSFSDKKDYRLVRLNNNKLTVLLISHAKLLDSNGIEEIPSTQESSDQSDKDENSDEDDEMDEDETTQEKPAAAALCVDVGSFHDPQSEVYGMAHFVEHMVFMGSSKYPDENSFDKHITTFGGSNNAMTENEHTVFYFEIVEKGFEGGLDRLAQFFISPLMKKDSMNREREAVESEFQNRINDDNTRVDQLFSSLGNPHHPSSTFGWGNLKTLKDNISDDDLYEKCHEFRKKHYVANKMYLCLQSRLDLDELQDLAVKYFSDVPYKPDIDPPLATNPEYSYENAFKPEFHEKVYYVKPKSNTIKLALSWLLPSMIKDYRSKPQHFVSHILGYEGKGSLCSYLRKNLLALKVSTGATDLCFDSNSLFSLFIIQITLTDHGFNNISKVLEAIFSYLLLMQKTEPSEDLFKELQKIEENSFRFRDEKSSDDNVEELATLMKYFPPKDIITALELYFEYDKEKTSNVIKALNQPKFNMMVLSDKYEKFDKVEKWFGTEYAEVDFPKEYKELWANRKLMDEFYLPEKNLFICSNFDIVFSKETHPNNSVYPEKVFENEYSECWYRLDDKFLLPHAHIYVYFIAPEMLKSSFNCTLMSLYTMLLTKHYLSETLYPAYIAGLEADLARDIRGLFLKVTGHNEKLHILVDIVIKYMKSFGEKLEKSAFETYKTQLKKNCYNLLIESQKLNKELRIGIVEKNFCTSYDIYHQLDKVKFEDLKEFSVNWLKQLKIQVLVQGNMKKEECVSITKNMLKNLNTSEIKDKSLIERRSRKIPEGKKYLKVKSMLPGNKNSTITNYYQIGESSINLHCVLDLFILILEEPLFNILRTEEQLGYAVQGMVRDNNSLLGISITIMSQEDKNPMNIVDEKIEDFVLEKMAKIIDELSDEDFETNKQSLIKIKSMIDTDLKTECYRNWSEIASEEYIFDRREREINVLTHLKKSNIVNFYKEQIKIENSRKLSVQVIGCNEKIVSLSESNENDCHKLHLDYITDSPDQQSIISDITEFTDSLYLYPVLKTKLN